MRHSNTSAATPTIPERNSRLRSGSLTLPSGGLPNTFGSSIFSSPWLPSTNETANGFPVLEELRSVTSADSVGDDFEHTLNYLGLNDHDPPPAATISELRNQAQAVIAGNLSGHLTGNHSRLRASTVSNPYRTRSTASLLSTPAAEDEDQYFDNYDDAIYAHQHVDAYDSYNASSLMTKSFKQADHLSIPTRPRAISVGTLDDPIRTLQRRTAGTDAHTYINEMSTQGAALSTNVPTPPGILKVDKAPSVRTSSSSNVHFPTADMPIGRGASAYLVAPASQNRSVSPKSEIPVSQVQTPTRSLWIGNLDSAVTREQLIHVFAPYGAIESLRLLPEKVLSFSILTIRKYLRIFTGMRLCQFRRTS